jgi:hypothetical protein
MDYRAYILDEKGHIIALRELDAVDDRDAVQQAQSIVDGHDVELWQRDRKISLLRRHSG